MLQRLLLAAALAVGLSSAVQAQTARTVATCGAQSLRVGDATNLFVDSTGVLCSTAGAGGGGAGSTGSVTSAGANGTSAQAIQGINGGVPVPVLAAGSGSQEQDVRASNTLNAATANAAVTLPINGQATVGLTFTGLAASGATVTFEQSNDGGATWTGINEVNAGTGVPSATRNTDGQTRVAVQGRTNLRTRVSTPGTGTITVASNISVREGLVALASPLPPGANSIGTIGNTAFGISGTLPGYATTPTFNLGTLNGAATAANQNVTAAGTTATSAQAVQGVTGGVPQNVTGTINDIPTASSAAVGAAPVTSTTAALTGKASAANLYGFSFTQGATAGFFALLNATAAPAASAAIAPLECVPVAANAYVARRQDIPDRYTVGLVIVSTSSCTTYTAVTPVLISAIVQ